MTVETFAMLMDDRMRSGQGFWDQLSEQMMRIGFAYDVTFDGQVERRLEPNEIAELRTTAEETAAKVRVDGRARPLALPGVQLQVVPTLQADGTRFSGPAETSRGWPRTVDILHGKAEQARRSGAQWLRANAHDGLWQFTEWAGYDLTQKTAALAPWIRQAVGSQGLDGVAISSGDVFGQGTFEPEAVVLPEGTCGLRRVLAPLRVRETIIVPLSEKGRTDAAHWAQLYGREPEWLGWALAAVGLPPAEDVMAWQPIA